MWDLTKTSIFPPQSYQIQNWAIFWNWHALYLSLRYFLFFNDDVNGFQIINNNDQVEFLLVIFEVFWGPNRVIFYIYGTILMYLRTFIIMFWFPHWSSWRTEWHVHVLHTECDTSQKYSFFSPQSNFKFQTSLVRILHSTSCIFLWQSNNNDQVESLLAILWTYGVRSWHFEDLMK